ncbi:hypothetical protein IJS77_01630 [bacterium]|nr:hypothetical protein [bacterium]
MQINKLSVNRFEYNKTNNPINNARNTFMQRPQNNVAFKGVASRAYNGLTEVLAKGLGKLANTKFTKNTVKFFNGESEGKIARSIGKFINIKEKWFQHAIAAESVYLTSFYMYNTHKSKAIPDEQKRPMMVNQALVTTLCTALGYTIDSKITKMFNKAKHIFTIANVTNIADKMKPSVKAATDAAKNNKGAIDAAIKIPLKHSNAIANGISKLKSVLVFGFIYRYLAPVFITPIANRVSEMFDKTSDKKAENNQKKKIAFPMSVNFASTKTKNPYNLTFIKK